MGSVAIIALFYTAQINLVALGGAAAVLAVMALCNRMGLKSLGLYLPLALILRYAMLLSGVHATIAGVLAAMTIPLDKRSEEHTSELQSLMRISYAVFCLKKKT